ncbi:MAG: response regulator, partial [Spirochaetales bacterium]|nr:response regulator [Candidatus Physcosoma equi]
MKVVAVDDEKLCLDNLVEILSSMDSISSIKGFQKPSEAMEYLKKHYVDVVFLDVRMPGMDGVTMARQIAEYCPDTNIIFATSYTHYLAEAFALHASGYILKPVTREAVVKEIKNLRFPPRVNDKGQRVQTFGHFEV